jgi:hypothetical protein
MNFEKCVGWKYLQNMRTIINDFGLSIGVSLALTKMRLVIATHFFISYS